MAEKSEETDHKRRRAIYNVSEKNGKRALLIFDGADDLGNIHVYELQESIPFHKVEDKSYRMNLFVNELSPEKEERQDNVIPDLVYRKEGNQKSIVEVKIPVDHRANGSPVPTAKEKNEIESDYAKLKKYYKDFDSKILVVAYLGDSMLKGRIKFPFEYFSKWIHSKFQDTDKIKVIVC